MFKRTFTAALVFGAAALAPPANADEKQVCLDREILVRSLEARYQETLQGAGLQSPQLLLEVWSSGVSGSFTVIVTNANGKSCVVAFGQNWFTVDREPELGTAG
jgi:hypothetical protein